MAGGDMTEAIKHIRTSLVFSSAQHGTRSILVTSAGPGEGKSMMAANLAITLAETGQRVLLIDADMRRPRSHEIFNLPQEPGLSNLLVGGSRPSEVVHAVPDQPNLLALPAGHIPPNPVELVGSQRFREYLRALSRETDWVVIDSPPVLVVTDASVMAQFVSGVVLVVAADQTSRHAAREAVEQLDAVNAKIIGTILNRVDLHRHPYYYSQYSRRHYSKYYVKSDRVAAAAAVVPPDKSNGSGDLAVSVASAVEPVVSRTADPGVGASRSAAGESGRRGPLF